MPADGGATTREAIAYLLLRVTIGVNLFLHGVARLIGDPAVFRAYLETQMQGAPVPAAIVHLVAAVLPWGEAVVGLLLLLGAWTTIVLLAAGLQLLLLQIGACLAQRWDAAGTQLLYVLILCILLAHGDRNRYSIDGLRRRPASGGVARSAQ